MTRKILLALLIISPVIGFSQIATGIKLVGLSLHPLAGNDLLLHSNKIDDEGYFTSEIGIASNISLPMYYRFRYGIELQAIKDRFGGLTASAGLKISWVALKYRKHQIMVGGGPRLYFWKGREYPNNHDDDENYNVNDSKAHKIMPITLHAEYVYEVSKKMRVLFGITQAHPKSLAFTAGIYIILPGFNGKGCNCPGYRN